LEGNQYPVIRAGKFHDVDVVLHWHPFDANFAFNGGTLAVNSAKFLFHRGAAHAALAPERGRSAAELYLHARNPSSVALSGVWDRILKLSQGATLMTETTLDVKEVGGDAMCSRKKTLAPIYS
jgi:aminobenzoyl-glutamate utilization protein B